MSLELPPIILWLLRDNVAARGLYSAVAQDVEEKENGRATAEKSLETAIRSQQDCGKEVTSDGRVLSTAPRGLFHLLPFGLESTI